MFTKKSVKLIGLFWFFIISQAQAQECKQFIINDDLDYASRDRYETSIHLPNNEKFIYVSYEELSSDVEPGHLILDSNNKIIHSKKREDYNLQMPISDVSAIWHQGSIYIIGKIIAEAKGNIRLIQVSPDLEIINASTFSLPRGSITGIQLNTINSNEIAFSYYDIQSNEFIMQRLNNEGEIQDMIQIPFESNIHGYQISFSSQNYAIATFNLLEGLRILKIDDEIQEIYYQANTNTSLFESDQLLITKDHNFVAYSIESDKNGLTERDCYLMKLNKQGIVIWDHELGDFNSTSNSIGDMLIIDEQIHVVGYTYAENNFDMFYQTIDQTPSPIQILFSSAQNDIPTKMIALPNRQLGIIGFTSESGFYTTAYALLLDEAGDLLNTYIEYGGMNDREPEYFNLMYNDENDGLDIIGNYYIYDRDDLAFYSFKSDVVIQNISLADFTQMNHTEIDGKGTGKMQIKWLAEDSQDNVFVAGFKQLGFAAGGCSACLSLNTPYLYKFNPEGELLWKDLYDPTNDRFNTPPSFLSIDSRDHAWMLTEEYNESGYLAKIIHYESEGTIKWEYQITPNGYMIDFHVDQENRGWILYSKQSQVHLDQVDENGNLITSSHIGNNEKWNFQMIIAEDPSNPFALIIYIKSIEDSHEVLKIKDGQIEWQTSIEIEDNSLLYSARADYSKKRRELALVDNEKIVTIDTDDGFIAHSFLHNIPVLEMETGEQEYFLSLKSNDEYTVITDQRLVKYSLGGEKLSDVMLPIEYGYHFTESDDHFLLAREDGKILYSDFDMERYELIENPQCYSVNGLEYLRYQTSNSIYNGGSNVFIGNNKIGMLGELYRTSLVGNPTREFDAYVPLATIFEVGMTTNTIDNDGIDPLHPITLSPNPTDGTFLNLDNLTGMPGEKIISIYNIVGQIAMQMKCPAGLSTMQIRLADHVKEHTGMYTISINNGQSLVVNKFMVVD